jgi:hypothetical protein
MVKKTVKNAAKAVETKVEQIVEDVKETGEAVSGAFTEGWNAAKAEANEDVATFTIDKWHVLLAAVVVTVAALGIIL